MLFPGNNKFSADSLLKSSIEKREAENAFRTLVSDHNRIDFCSNDYLGFSKLLANDQGALSIKSRAGATGSRLISGNSAFVERLEKEVAAFHNAEAGLIYNSGYDANTGLFSCLLKEGNTIIYDELIHASIHDGIRLGRSSSYMFRHNNLDHLEERLKIAEGIIFVAVESVYSMDGDLAPLNEIVQICEKYGANIIVDEAHATGVFGPLGKGRVVELGIEDKIFARIHTFGKSLGCQGAIVLGSTLLRDFQVNFSRSFIYTTALSYNSLQLIERAYQLLSVSVDRINNLKHCIAFFVQNIKQIPSICLIDSISPIQSVVVSGNSQVKALAEVIQSRGMDVRPILSPTVFKGKERLRICLHEFNTEMEISSLIEVVKENSHLFSISGSNRHKVEQ